MLDREYVCLLYLVTVQKIFDVSFYLLTDIHAILNGLMSIVEILLWLLRLPKVSYVAVQSLRW